MFADCLCVVQVNQLSGLIELINGDLSKLDRKKLITLCTIDVHARDVIQRLMGEAVICKESLAGWLAAAHIEQCHSRWFKQLWQIHNML